MLWLLDDLVS